MSTCGVRYNRHIRVIDKTLVKSSKARTIVLHNCNAKLCVIMQLLPMFTAKRTSEQQTGAVLCHEEWSPKAQ